jgi:hypothetical protein
MITTLITTNRILTTEHIAQHVFPHRGSPDKRAREYLGILVGQKLVEGFNRELGKSKVWRLTKKGREHMKVSYPPISPKGHKLTHFLSITDAYFGFLKVGNVKRWFLEPREKFMSGSKSYTYAPDAYLFLEKDGKIKPYIVEVQLSPLTSKRWAEKWAVAAQFFDSGAYKKAGFQIMKVEIKPQIIVITNQPEETVRTGVGSLPLSVIRSASDLKM